MNYEKYIQIFGETLYTYWQGVRNRLLEWKQSYKWPEKISLNKAITRRNQLEEAIQNDLHTKGYLSKKSFNDVIFWGFGRRTDNSERDIALITEKSFKLLESDKLNEAAATLIRLKNIGISSASKLLALSNQNELGIYDSRSADGLKDLIYQGQKLLLIPPGRVIKGDVSASQEDFCRAFQHYIWTLRSFRDFAQSDPGLKACFSRVADIEIAFFARSKNESRPQLIETVENIVSANENDCYMTLGYGNRKKRFWASVDEQGIIVLTGIEGKSAYHINHSAVLALLAHFKDKGWFQLGNSVDNIKTGSLGEYVKVLLSGSPKYASHIASVLVEQGRLEYRYGPYNRVELYVNQ